MHKRTISTAAGAVLAAATLALGPVTSAEAATFVHDGHHAWEDGCRADQKVIYHTLISDGTKSIGYVDLMYSLNCHSAWAHVHSIYTVTNQTWVTHGTIHRNYDGKEYYCTGAEGSQDCWTPMVYDKGMTSYARGGIDPNGATNAYYSARTPSY